MLFNKEITIQSLQAFDNRYSLTDSENNKYSFFTTKQDGSETQAFNTFKTSKNGGQLGVGDYCRISYKEDSKTNQYGKTVVYKTIVSFLGGIKAPANVQKPITEPKIDLYGKRLALHGMVNGLLASGKLPHEIAPMLQDLINLEEALEKALSMEPKKDALDREPSNAFEGFDLSSDIDLDSIPF